MAKKSKIFKVGDKVKIIDNLKEKTYEKSGLYCAPEMLKFAGKETTIREVTIEHPDKEEYGYHYVLEDCCGWSWSLDMLEKVPTKKSADETASFSLEDLSDLIEKIAENTENQYKKQEEVLDNVITKFANSSEKTNKAIENISKALNTRTIYDDAIIENVIEKFKSIPDEEIKNAINNSIEEHIRKTYGCLPKKIEITSGNEAIREMTGLFHEKFETICKMVNKKIPVMLTGPAGAGKNHTLEQVAEALNLDFYFTNAVTQEFKLTGFIDANGVYQETQFYKAFKDGGLFFLDEIDASVPESLVILNSAIANGYFDFPNGRLNAHENFRVICAGNTYGTGADMVYVGRNALDGATLDRFVVVTFGYDENVEKGLAFNEELYEFIKELRELISKNSLRYIVSMRATINATKLLEIGMDKKDILNSVIIKNMQTDDLNILAKKIGDSNVWEKTFKEIVKER